jgi:hypothetical protein
VVQLAFDRPKYRCTSEATGKLDLPVEEVAEEVFRNHDFDVSDNVLRLIGTVRTHAKALRPG